MSAQAKPRLLTTPQAAKTLGYTIQHTRLLIRQGKLGAQKIGRDWVISDIVLDNYKVKKELRPAREHYD